VAFLCVCFGGITLFEWSDERRTPFQSVCLPMDGQTIVPELPLSDSVLSSSLFSESFSLLLGSFHDLFGIL